MLSTIAYSFFQLTGHSAETHEFFPRALLDKQKLIVPFCNFDCEDGLTLNTKVPLLAMVFTKWRVGSSLTLKPDFSLLLLTQRASLQVSGPFSHLPVVCSDLQSVPKLENVLKLERLAFILFVYALFI